MNIVLIVVSVAVLLGGMAAMVAVILKCKNDLAKERLQERDLRLHERDHLVRVYLSAHAAGQNPFDVITDLRNSISSNE